MIPRDIKMIIDFTLGDGWLGMRSGRKNAAMRIEHSSKQREYAIHKQERLESIGLPVKAREYVAMTGKNTGRSYYQVNVNQDERLTTAYKWLYNKGQKGIDKALLKQLDAETLAYWFMDDGSAKLVKYTQKPDRRYYYDSPKIGGFKFSNQSFTFEENQLIVNWMFSTFGIKARVTNYNGYEVHISGIENKQQFLATIKPYIIPSMTYKIQYPFSFRDIGFRIVQRERLSEETFVERCDSLST